MTAARHRYPSPEILTAAVAIVAGISACSRSTAEGARSPDSVPQAAQIWLAQAQSAARPGLVEVPLLQPDLPTGLSVDASDLPRESVQRELAEFAWRTFVALCWPARPDGRTDRSQVPGLQGDNATLWGSWATTRELSLQTDPLFAPRDGEYPGEFPPGTRVLTDLGRAQGAFAGFSPSLRNGPLIDQNGRYTRSETLVDRALFEALIARGVSGPTDAGALTQTLLTKDLASASRSAAGAMAVEAVWKILSPAEAAAGRFHAVPALLRPPFSAVPSGGEEVETATVGLVGLTISHKPAGAAHWFRFTFEHVDNYPTAGEPADRAAYNFYNKAVPDAPANLAPAPPWDPRVVEPTTRRPQLLRPRPIDASFRELNAAYQAALRAPNPASVWQYYQLVDTGWSATQAGAPGRDLADAGPAALPDLAR